MSLFEVGVSNYLDIAWHKGIEYLISIILLNSSSVTCCFVFVVQKFQMFPFYVVFNSHDLINETQKMCPLHEYNDCSESA